MNSMKSRSCTHRRGRKRTPNASPGRKANLNDANPIKIRKGLSMEKAFTSFVFRAVYQIVHDDGIGYEFLYGVAKRLHDKEVALLGAGPKGNAPLILRDKGSPHRYFHTASLRRLRVGQIPPLLLLSNQELKLAAQVRMIFNQTYQRNNERRKDID